MTTIDDQIIEDSPFHSGEQILQSRTGKRETTESMGRRFIRSYMPDQHREFYQELPFMVVGGVDENDWPWATLLSGQPGFVKSPTATRLDIAAVLPDSNPLAQTLTKRGKPLGLLGIEMMARRRNRINGRISETSESGFSVSVDQSFGNCPQYIQNWKIEFADEAGEFSDEEKPFEQFFDLDDDARHMIRSADTFFVASFVKAKERPEVEGVDVSHRGGRPGFVKVEGNTLTVPDYSGNFHFNTLGNFLVNPKAGLVFIDFSTGDLLMLTGTVELLAEDAPEIVAFQGAERGWRFTLEKGVKLYHALPFTGTMTGFSPNTLMTGDWNQTQKTLSTKAKKDAWLQYKIIRIEDESELIRSFYLQPTKENGLIPFKPGQYLTIRLVPTKGDKPVVRTYTVSSTPADSYYRISVKLENSGLISKHLHHSLNIGDVIEAKAPRGDFYVNSNVQRPVVLLGGGVGITPMISMATYLVQEGIRTRRQRPVTVFHATRSLAQRAFNQSFRELEKQALGEFRYYSFISRPESNALLEKDFDGSGHISADLLRQNLALDDYDFYLCGPAGFMQGMYDALQSLGVQDKRIYSESFGPAELQRKVETVPLQVVSDEAKTAVIKFSKSGKEQSWQAGDPNLLEVAESSGINPDFSCRKGVCGACKTKIKSGTVVYRTQPTAEHSIDEALICCAVPAKNTELLELDL